MGVIIRQSLKASVGSYIGIGIGIVNNLFVATQFLSPDQLAISRLLLENSLVFGAVAHLGAPFISDRFFSRFRDDEKKHHGFLGFLLLFPLIGMVVFGLFFYLFNHYLQDYYRAESSNFLPYLPLILPLTAFNVYILVFEAYCRGNARIAVPTFIREVYLRGANVLIIIVFAVGWVSYDWMLYLMVGTYGLSVLILLVYIRSMGRWYLTLNRRVWAWSFLREAMTFGSIVIVSGLGMNLVLFIDRNQIAHLLGTSFTAVFIISSYIAGIIEIPSKSVRQISGPIIANAVRLEDWPQVKSLYQKSAINMLIIGGLAFLLVACSVDNILGMLPKAAIYTQGKYVVLIIAFSKLIDMSFGLCGEILTYSKYYRITTVMVLTLAVFALIANEMLIPILGINGSALATAFTTLLFAVMKVGYVKWKFNMLPFTRDDITLLLIIGGVGTLGFLIPNFGTHPFVMLLSVGVKSAIITTTFVGLVLYFKISPEVNSLFEQFVDKVKERGGR
jgi:O-antigen/teichoic acid export membrane protein